jgi:PAS domain S-box-containing protein
MFPAGSQCREDGRADSDAILDALPDAVFVLDVEDGRILSVNRAGLRMFRVPEGAPRDLDVEALSAGGPDFGAEEARAWLRVARDAGEAECRWRSRRLDGSIFWSEVRLARAGADRIVAQVRDVTDRIQAQEALARAEEKFEKLFRCSPVSILLTTFPDGRIVEVNETFLATSGFSREEILGRNTRGFWLDPEAREAYLESLSRKRVAGHVATFRMKTGEDRIGRVSGEILDLAGGLHILTAIEDITEQVLAEGRLRKVSRLYAALSQVNQRLTRVKRPEEAYEGLCRGLVEGGGFWAAWVAIPDPVTGRFQRAGAWGGQADWWEELVVYATEDRPEGRGTMGSAFRQGRPVIANDFDHSAMTAPWHALGRAREFRAAASFPLLRGDGEVFGVICIYAREVGFFGEQEIGLLCGLCEDLTFVLEDLAREGRRRELEAMLAQTQKMESLGNLAGGVAHDLNNVLGAVLGLASIEAERAPEGTPTRRSLETVVQACIRGREVIQGLLLFARHDLGTLQPVDLNRVVQDLVGLLGRTTLQRIRFETRLDPDLRCLEGDPSALNSALMNVCLNAVDAMPGGGLLAIQTRNGGDGSVEVEVRDTGEGMTEEVSRRATEPFFTTKPAGKGTGLGLAMVYGTVQAHKGALDIQSRPGEGTLVRMTFPGTDARPRAPGPEREEGPASPKRILLVDDDAFLRESVAEVLAWQGHEVVCVPGGAEALERLAQDEPFDLVILDMNMPGLSGGETLPRILGIRPDQRVLVSTGYTDRDLKVLTRGNPLIRLLAKPFTTKELAGCIRDFG